MIINMHEMKSSIYNIPGYIAKQDDRYKVIDNTKLDNLVLSSTELYANQSTSGHTHERQEEVYYFVNGHGKMWLDDEEFYVANGDVVQISEGVYHRVEAGPEGLYFVCVFEGRRNH